MTMMVRPFLVMIVLLFKWCFVNGDWVDDCRVDGFDPDRLACSTCKTILKDEHKRCDECCQSWLDTPRITRPFHSAVLVERQYGGDELTDFLKHDWKELVKEIPANRLHHVAPTSNSASSYFFRGRITSQLLFFDSPVDPKRDIVQLQKEAQDSFDLPGLKRDDLKDMIRTLLQPTKKKT